MDLEQHNLASALEDLAFILYLITHVLAFISSLPSSGFGGFNAPDRGHHSGVCFVLSFLSACLVQEVG